MTDLFDEILHKEYGIQQRRRDAQRDFESDLASATLEGIPALQHLARQEHERRLEQEFASQFAYGLPEAERPTSRSDLAATAVLAVLKRDPQVPARSIARLASEWISLSGKDMTEQAIRLYLNRQDFVAYILSKHLDALSTSQQMDLFKAYPGLPLTHSPNKT